MISPEQLIRDLRDQIARLETELSVAQQDIRDFEVLAIEWRKGHADLERRYRIETTSYKQIIESLRDEIDELKSIGE